MRTLIVSGYMAKDCELKTISNGNKVLNLSIGSNEYGDEKNSDGTNKPMWINVSSFKEEAIRMAQYLKKGSNIIVIGDMKTRMYQNNNQEWNCAIEINNADIKFNGTSTKKEEGATETSGTTTAKTTVKHTDMDIPVQTATQTVSDDKDELPF